MENQFIALFVVCRPTFNHFWFWDQAIQAVKEDKVAFQQKLKQASDAEEQAVHKNEDMNDDKDDDGDHADKVDEGEANDTIPCVNFKNVRPSMSPSIMSKPQKSKSTIRVVLICASCLNF